MDRFLLRINEWIEELRASERFIKKKSILDYLVRSIKSFSTVRLVDIDSDEFL
jgi:hypothetical protein